MTTSELKKAAERRIRAKKAKVPFDRCAFCGRGDVPWGHATSIRHLFTPDEGVTSPQGTAICNECVERFHQALPAVGIYPEVKR